MQPQTVGPLFYLHRTSGLTTCCSFPSPSVVLSLTGNMHSSSPQGRCSGWFCCYSLAELLGEEAEEKKGKDDRPWNQTILGYDNWPTTY